MRFILVRHPQTVANAENRLVGVTNSPYTDHGHKQAKALIDFLSTANYDAIYSSPISRSRYIGEEVGKKLQKEVHIMPWLREINFGDMEGVAFDEFEKYGVDLDDYRKNLFDFRYPNGEMWVEFYADRKRYIDELRSQKGTCLLTSHGGTIWALSAAIVGKELQEHRGPILSNAGIMIANCDEDNGEIVKVIDIDDVMSGKLTQFNHWE